MHYARYVDNFKSSVNIGLGVLILTWWMDKDVLNEIKLNN